MINIGGISINPRSVLCLGTNYMDHIEETKLEIPKEPLIFPKLVSSLICDGDDIIYPKMLYNNRKLNRVDPEIELAFIVNQRCKNLSQEDAYDYILGYTVFNDVTARKMQTKDIFSNKPWFRSKSFDTFAPIGPRIVKLDDPHNLELELKVNGEVRQKSNTKHLIFKNPVILEYITKFFMLERGDIIATGTPAGIKPIQPGDVLEATIENVGTLKNRVILEGTVL